MEEMRFFQWFSNTVMSLQKMSPHFSCTADPTCCTGNGIYSSFRNNRNFWLEYSTPPTTRYPEYEEDFFDSVQGAASSSTSRPPGPHFLTANHSRLQSPVGATTFLHCQVDDLKDLQVRCCIKFFPDFFCLLSHAKILLGKALTAAFSCLDRS